MLDVILPGTGGTMPLKTRWLATAYLRFEGHCILVDCGEGTQIALRECGVSLKPIDTLCLTHFHADHVSGLPGFLLSMGNDGRTEPLTILGPPGTVRVVAALRTIAPGLPYEIRIHELSGEHMTWQAGRVEITVFPLKHGTVCYGYRFQVPRAGRFDPDRARAAGIPLKLWSVLQKQEQAELDGVVYTQDQVLGAARRGLTVCYCVDSRPVPIIAEMARGAELLVCEGMFGEAEKLERAIKTGHMLMTEAARIAREAQPEQLVFTHYSPSVPDPEGYLASARQLFPAARCGTDGMQLTLRFRDDPE